MISFKNNIKKSTLSFKVIVVCILLSGSLVSPGFAIPDPDAITAKQYEDSWQNISGSLTAEDAVEERFGSGSWKLVDNYELFDAIGQSVSIYIKGNPESESDGLCDPMGLVYDITNLNLEENIDVNDDAGLGGFTDDYNGLTCGNSAFDSFFTIPSWDSNYRIQVSSNGSLIDENDRTLDTINSGVYTLYVSVGNFDGTCYDVVGTVLTNGTACKGSLVIDNTVTSIAAEAFIGSALTSITIGNSVTNIGNEAFSSNPDLTSVDFGNSAAIIGDDAFANNPALTSVDFGEFVTIIGYSAFANNNNIDMTSVIIPDSVTSIGPYAFWHNDSLNSVTFLGVAAPTVDEDAFKDVYIGATAYVEYNATGIEPNEYGFWRHLFVNFGSAPTSNVDCIKLGSPDGYFTIEDNVVTGNNLCAGEATIPSGVTSIEDNAFNGNTILTSVIIPDSVTSIGLGAFRDNTALISVDFGDSVESIGAYAFTITGLTTITIPDSVTSIDQAAFENIAALTSVTFLGNRLLSISQSVFAFNPNLRSITIPNSVTSIGDYAFEQSGLESVTIPDSVTSIGNSAFQNNTALTSVIIGNSVTSIGNYAFYGNILLTSVTIPDSVTSIGDGAFESNTALTSVTIPDSVTSIGNYAFYANTALTSVIIGSSVINIGEDAFSHNPALTSVRFLGNAPAVGTNGFLDVASGATANIRYNATGFDVVAGFWNRLIVVLDSAPAGDSGSDSSPTTKTITPVAVKVADSITNMKNKTYISKYSMKTKLRENNLFKYSVSDSFKYQVFNSSKKSCGMRGNYVMRYENSKTCDLYITRTNAKGISNKYWVKINYSK